MEMGKFSIFGRSWMKIAVVCLVLRAVEVMHDTDELGIVVDGVGEEKPALYGKFSLEISLVMPDFVISPFLQGPGDWNMAAKVLGLVWVQFSL